MRKYGILLLVLTMTAGVHAQRQVDMIIHDDTERSYQIYVPPSYDATTPATLLLVLHGGGGDTDSIIEITNSGFDDLADEYGFILVYPEAVNRQWNDARPFEARQTNADDVGFIRALIEQLSAEYAIDPERIFVTGMSNGGHMAYRLACESSDLVTAIAPVVALMPAEPEQPCLPDEAVAVLMLVGLNDPLIPYEGGEVRIGLSRRGTVISAVESARFWAEVNGCAEEPVSTALDDKDPNDGTRIYQTRFTDCAAPVELYTVEGGGHTWPGGWQYLGERLVGVTSRDIDANVLIWTFFDSVQESES
jgi:polyhydroxybutyrate depolymerase